MRVAAPCRVLSVQGPVIARVDPASLRLSGGLIDVRAGQVLGVMACDIVDRRADIPIETSMKLVDEVLGPVGARRGNEHGEGQQRLLADVLACAGGEVVLWVDPGWAVDAASGDHLVQAVRRRGASVIMACRDVDLVARWCDRVLVVDEHEVVADGRPSSVVDNLPYPPQIAQVFPGCHVVKTADVTLIPGVGAKEGRAHAQLV